MAPASVQPGRVNASLQTRPSSIRERRSSANPPSANNAPPTSPIANVMVRRESSEIGSRKTNSAISSGERERSRRNSVGSQAPTARTGMETEDKSDFFEHRSFFAKVVDTTFSVVFFMAHGNKANLLMEYVAIIIEDLQLIT
ncbi:hypothetical protein HDU76_004013, partial [Blyttiomyces sp. JEL0837]